MSPSLPLPQGGAVPLMLVETWSRGSGGGSGGINWDMRFCGGSRERGLRNFVVFG